MITFRFQIYNSKHNKHINCMLADACFVWNRCLALQRKYYAIYKSFIPVGRLKAHFAKRYTMNRLHSQTVQGVTHDRDLNAARNIHRRGISDLGSGGKTGLALAVGVCQM